MDATTRPRKGGERQRSANAWRVVRRRRIVIIDYDHGRTVHRLDLYRSSRIDCYDVHVDGEPWKRRIGWSRVLEGLRKSMPRVISPRSL